MADTFGLMAIAMMREVLFTIAKIWTKKQPVGIYFKVGLDHKRGNVKLDGPSPKVLNVESAVNFSQSE
jgi:hypothetical protein